MLFEDCDLEGFIAKDVKAFTANPTHVCISPETKKVVQVPEKLQALLE